MNGPTHIPIHPRFQKNTFGANMFKPNVPPQKDADMEQQAFGVPDGSWNSNDQFDNFEATEFPRNNETVAGQDVKKRNPYDWIIMFMALIIVVLILIVVWMVLSNNDEQVSEKVVNPNYMRPPGFGPVYSPQGYQQAPPQGYQQAPPQGYQQAPPQGYQQAPPQGYQQAPPQTSQPDPNASDEQATAKEMDIIMSTLREKNMKGGNLSVDEYTVTDEKNKTYQDIYNEDTVEEEIATDNPTSF